MTFTLFRKVISTSSLVVMLTEEGGVCYLRAMGRVTKVADITVPHPDHSDIEWYAPADNEPDPKKVFRVRLMQYAAAVITAIARSRDIGRIYLYGSEKHISGVLEHLPKALQKQCIAMQEEGTLNTTRSRVSQRIRKSMLRRTVYSTLSPFSSTHTESGTNVTRRDTLHALIARLWPGLASRLGW